MGVYSTMALAEVANENTIANVSSSAAQFMIETYRSDLSLFNAVIECDFATALGEAGIIAFTEADQKEADKEQTTDAKRRKEVLAKSKGAALA